MPDSKLHNVNLVVGDDCLLYGKVILHDSNSKITIGNRVFIGEGSELNCKKEITIGDDVMLSWGVTVIDTNAHSIHSEQRKNDVLEWKQGPAFKNWSHVRSEPVILKNKCWIGFRSIILKGVTIGTGSVVAAGSVVTRDTEDFTVVGGNPANYIKHTN
jgi:acetyltransferase-like isoleucine patch superfamily enzyme